MFALEEKFNLPHKILIDEKKDLMISGVNEVKSFDDETIILNTVGGILTVKGEGMKILGSNTQTGDLSATGKIYAVAYTASGEKGGFFAKVFR